MSSLARKRSCSWAPALGKVSASGETDVVIVGAGAAGIAAARRIGAGGLRFALIEANDKIGGRCVTDTQIFGVPYDRGAHSIHMPDVNPLAKQAGELGLEVYPCAKDPRLRIGRRYVGEGEVKRFLTLMANSNDSIAKVARCTSDVCCLDALPNDLAEWQATIEFVLGPFLCGKELSDVSAADFANSAERNIDSYCRQGYGTLLARLGGGIPVNLSTVVKHVDSHGPSGVKIETTRGSLTGRAVIITASTGVLAADKIRFTPALPSSRLGAIAGLGLGSYDRVALELEGNPLGLGCDDLVFEKTAGRNTAALLGNVSDTALSFVDIAGEFGRELSDDGDASMAAFALDWLSNLYGANIRNAVKRTHVTRWNTKEWVLGAFSAASPGCQNARKLLMEPIHDRIWFAGEAMHETLWGTVGGAWESGERAAKAALMYLETQVDR